MKRTVLIFGLISGAISSAMMLLTLPLIDRGTINFENGEVIGYTAIFLSFLLVFFGIRSYRERYSVEGQAAFDLFLRRGVASAEPGSSCSRSSSAALRPCG